MDDPSITARSRMLATEKMWKDIVEEKLKADDLRIVYLTERVRRLEDKQLPEVYNINPEDDEPLKSW